MPYMKLKYKDIFDMKAFYEALYEYLKENEWGDPDDTLDATSGEPINPTVPRSEHWETYYGERIDAKGLRELWIQWRLFKDPKEAPFLRYYLDIDFHCLGLAFGVEIVKEGMKLSVNRGEVELTINSYIEKVYEKKFTEGGMKWLLKPLTEMFTKRIYRKELKAREKELYQETYALQQFIKQWFKMKRYLPYEEVKSFFPSYAWPSHVKE